ncbi:MAG TPA: HAMP domain-containing sensor histidine kinase [Chloroflexia bacterium]|nr:HAMP domain-containing sensor histidine kinase [Chloroflexia bacterium]
MIKSSKLNLKGESEGTREVDLTHSLPTLLRSETLQEEVSQQSDPARWLELSGSPKSFQKFSGEGLAVTTFRWVGGLYFLILGISLLLLPYGSLDTWLGEKWLAGLFMILTGFVLLWSGVLNIPQRLNTTLGILLAVPLFYVAVLYLLSGSFSPSATLAFFTLGLLYVSFAGTTAKPGTKRADLLGLILGVTLIVQGLDFLFHQEAAAYIPPGSVLSSAGFGLLFLASGSGVVLTQWFPRSYPALKRIVHLAGGLTILGLWITISARVAPEYYVLGVAVMLRGIATLFLPWWGALIDRFDSRAFRPRVALSLVTVALVPVLVALPLVLDVLKQHPGDQVFARQLAFGVTLVIGLVAGVAGWWLAGLLTGSLTRLTQGVNRIAAGEREVSLAQQGTTELENLSAAVETMASALDARRVEREALVTQLQQQNQALQEMKLAREDYFRAISHDLRNPLTGITGFAQQLAKKLAQQDLEKEAALAQTVIRLSNRVNIMLEELAVSLKKETGLLQLQLEMVQLVPFAFEISTLLEQGQQAGRIRVVQGENLPAVSADRSFLERIFTNLLSNALKYSPPGSPINITFACDEREVVITVTDQGQGIAPEEQERLFTRYYRTKSATANQAGLGLGLYVTRTLVEAHNGRIWVDSRPGAGSSFCFTLPLQAEAARLKAEQ